MLNFSTIDKDMFNDRLKVTIIASIDVILMFLVKYLDMPLGNDLKIQKWSHGLFKKSV